MSLIVTFFLVGTLLLALEVVVPGAVLGIIGGLSLLGGVIVSFNEFGASGGGLATILALGLIGLTLFIEFKYLPGSRLARTFSMTDTVSGQSQPALATSAEVVGSVATALTPLSPTGYVELAGKRYEAALRQGHAAVGDKLTVVGLDNFRLIVNRTTSSNQTS